MKRSKRKPPEVVGSVMEMRAGPGPAVTDMGGKVWRLGWNTQDAKSHLESLVLSRAAREAVRLKRAMKGDEAEEYFTAFQNRVDAGYYHTFGEGWKYTMASPDASGLFLLSLLRHQHPSATEEDAQSLLDREPEQVALAVGAIAPDFFAAVLVQKKMGTGAAVKPVAEKLAAVVLSQFPTTARAPVTG